MHFMYMVLCLHVHLNTRRGHKATMRCHVGSGNWTQTYWTISPALPVSPKKRRGWGGGTDFLTDFFGGFFLCSHMVTSHQNEHLQNLILLAHTHFVYVYMLAMCRHGYTWRTKPNVRCLQSYFSRQGLSQNLDMANLARLACKSQGSSLTLSSLCWDYKCASLYLAFLK